MLTTKQHKINRKVKLAQADISQQEIANRLTALDPDHPVSRQAINNELRGEYRSERLRLGMCDIIGVDKEIFWPEFYGEQSTESAENIVHHDIENLSSRC